ncbi:microsomal glutathione S-transferase 1 [Halyomorpha halys]|uniref:microsomal glutathione S-transferase 1 n=1 Tax=Halyomorpha halys TaxID=286706 RepID=UPI0006D510A3|nr:microsomal glutathione S-transferase 1-like [Halyomorpha halys]
MSYANLADLLSFSNPVFRSYLVCNSVLVLKVLGVAPLIGRHRFAKKIFLSPEDAKMIPGAKVADNDPDIERCRRAHLNDIENIPLFFTAALGYLLTNPEPTLAINLMRAYTAARIAHTFVYAVVVVPQPARFIAFGIGYVITGYMAVSTILKFF